MTLPRAPEARIFYQAAKQRFEDAKFLLEGRRTTAAVYLSGYSVECMLKALILSRVPGKMRQEVLKTFRGAKAHDYEWLRAEYLKYGGPPFPPSVAPSFALVNTWTTDMRYKPGTLKERDADAFVKA